jgi:hypothetical protein
MYIDSLTIAALLVFVVTVAAFVRYCLVRVCGLKSADDRREESDATREKQA